MIWTFNLLKWLQQAVIYINHTEHLLHTGTSPRLKDQTTRPTTKDILYSTEVASCVIVNEAPQTIFEPLYALSHIVLSQLPNNTLLSMMSLHKMLTANEISYITASFGRPRKFYSKSATLWVSSRAQKSSCLMEVPGVIMTLCSYENIKGTNGTIREMCRLRICPAD